MSDWMIFRGRPQDPHDGISRLKDSVPPWRNFQNSEQYRGRTYVPSSHEETQLVNAALTLRRPLLVTGPPGCGKSSLAYAIAEELKLGDVLKWPINSRSTLKDGLYLYDAIARLRDVNFRQQNGNVIEGALRDVDDISRYLNLQWLGTALASSTPRVVLIDEIDKADIDLPNDLLHVLEEGTFSIPELQRISDTRRVVPVQTCETGKPSVPIELGRVQCSAFPIIVITSNGERELPMAFHRRCLRLDIQPPSKDQLLTIVMSHLKGAVSQDPQASQRINALIESYISLRQDQKVMATDQLLNLVYLIFNGKLGPESDDAKVLEKLIFRGLNR